MKIVLSSRRVEYESDFSLPQLAELSLSQYTRSVSMGDERSVIEMIDTKRKHDLDFAEPISRYEND